MRVLVTAVRAGADPQDVVITADDAATAADVAEVLTAALGSGRPQGRDALPGRPLPVEWTTDAPTRSADRGSRGTATLWVDGHRCAPGDDASTVLRDGMRVSVDDTIGPLMRTGEPAGRYELRVAGGPGAGRVVRLAAGVATIGSHTTCTLAIADPFLPPAAARITVHADGQVRVTPHPEAQLSLDDEPLAAEREWPCGGLLRAGDSLFVLDEPAEPDAHLSATGEGGLAYNRPPRLSPLRPRARLVVPARPGKAETSRFQILSSLVPLVFGLAMYFMTKQVYMLLFCLMSPMMMVGQWVSDVRYGRKQHRKSMKQYRAEIAEHAVRVREVGKQDQRNRRIASPDPAEVLLFATGPRRRLWERRITDPDAMRLRLGVADLPADIELVMARGGSYEEEEQPEPPQLTDVPVPLPYAELGVVGVAGERERVLSTARWLAVQAAALHSPRDLSLVVLADTAAAGAAWSWAHWLPHTAPQLGQDCVALLGSDSEAVARRVNELLNELERRKAASQHHSAMGALRPDPYVLVVLDGARLLRRMPGVPQLLQEGPRHGIFALCLDADERLLPEECSTAICWSPESPTRAYLRGSGLESIGPVLVDQVALDWCELVARSLAPVRDVSRDDADSALPTAARLLSLLGMPDPTGADIERIWRAGGSTTEAPIGIAADGPFTLDIRRDGPHALVAGTTGAGKSELLQTIIASLAVANRPDALNYVLIDYKGGSAFMDCARLPHTVGMVSDLDAHLTERALASLAAELHRREEILFNTGTKDIEDYNDTRKLQPELEPMPRLVLIIDEFASLVAELPDFIAGLVDIARRGRSLGVHLVLATQRPAGVVSADIRANTNLRIALRVTDGSESSDVIDAPDAGAISKSTPGRAYVRSGAQSLVGVQSARIGGRRPSTGQLGPKATLTPLAPSAYGRPLPKRAEAADDGTMVTDLAVLVDAVRAGAQAMDFAAPRSPWLPPLPDLVSLAELPEPHAGKAGQDVRPAPFGLTDLPASQARAAFALDLVDGEHTLLVGGPRSGRSTALRTLAGSLARGTSPTDVHVYAVDCGSNALLPLVALPHVGAVVTRDQPDRVRRLIDRLLAEISRRQQMLAVQGASSAAEQRASAPAEERLPWMVVLLDAWEGFTAAFEGYNYGQLIEAMQRIFREGSAVGVRVVMTSDRSGLTGQVASVFGERMVLRLADPSDYSTAGFRAKDVPKHMPPGRALRLADNGVQETQLGLLDPDPSGQAQVAALRRLGAEARERQPQQARSLRPMRVDALPTRISTPDMLALDPDHVAPSPLWTLLGVGGDELQPIGVDLRETGPGVVIAGPPKSGRSTMLLGAARALLRAGTPVVLITPRRSPLRELEGAAGVLGMLGVDGKEEDLQALISKAEGPYVVLIDDAELLYDEPLDEALEAVLRSGMDGDHGLVAAGTTDTLSSQYRGFVTEARKTRSGVLLTPQSSSDGELFNIRLPANSGTGSPGSGLLIRGGGMMPIQGVID
ncbi:FtsK/SpoIIIE domain-containing protein [Streptomyces zagrosensis]|uniref:S-DNA-T family DNA segregation ATPase FtsK/SpoIIIE n=1 Tax=Streptomyces zagrosensis TaxID=1042984 RepID=A0A7W9Q7L5_9ACTN|nr:FtsK/SpoIIIE domain-containing protein [Streptomyces zagrosensis]MBB5934678.1 S-DNA-T family DNA segregation ATPase FtsK/SpoIIIE [Streptomyces zagrosensis]